MKNNKLFMSVHDRIIYCYHVAKLFPTYILSCIKQRGKSTTLVKFYSDEETVDMIIKEGKSLSRFGDGEFRWMSGVFLNSFQNYSESLPNDLKKAFLNDNKKLIIGIPKGVFDSTGCRLYAKMWWKIIRIDFLSQIKPYLSFEKKYANASITRPYIDYVNTEFANRSFNNIKRIWEERDICILEGAETKLGIGNDLYDNAKSIVRIIAPAENAYSKKEEIKKTIREKINKEKLIISALGPTATVLASELCDEGYQFVDIGHVDIEYMWFLEKCFVRKPIRGKYTNEVGGSSKYNIYDENRDYLNSIIATIL